MLLSLRLLVTAMFLSSFSGCLPAERGGLEMYRQFLRSQNGKRERLPPLFKETFQKDFTFDIDDIWYVENVQTLTAQVVTLDRTIYTPGTIDVKGQDFVKMVLHELTHVKQQDEHGEMFYHMYGAQRWQSLGDVAASGKWSVDSIHDNIGLEKEAIDSAKEIQNKTKLICPKNNCLLSSQNNVKSK